MKTFVSMLCMCCGLALSQGGAFAQALPTPATSPVACAQVSDGDRVTAANYVRLGTLLKAANEENREKVCRLLLRATRLDPCQPEARKELETCGTPFTSAQSGGRSDSLSLKIYLSELCERLRIAARFEAVPDVPVVGRFPGSDEEQFDALTGAYALTWLPVGARAIVVFPRTREDIGLRYTKKVQYPIEFVDFTSEELAAAKADLEATIRTQLLSKSGSAVIITGTRKLYVYDTYENLLRVHRYVRLFNTRRAQADLNLRVSLVDQNTLNKLGAQYPEVRTQFTSLLSGNITSFLLSDTLFAFLSSSTSTRFNSDKTIHVVEGKTSVEKLFRTQNDFGVFDSFNSSGGEEIYTPEGLSISTSEVVITEDHISLQLRLTAATNNFGPGGVYNSDLPIEIPFSPEGGARLVISATQFEANKTRRYKPFLAGWLQALFQKQKFNGGMLATLTCKASITVPPARGVVVSDEKSIADALSFWGDK